MKGKNRRRVLGVVVSFLALVGVGASATYYVYEPANDGFLKYPTIVFLHVVFGGLYLAFAGLQFVGRVNSASLLPPLGGEGAGFDRRGGRGDWPVHGARDPLQRLDREGVHRRLRHAVLGGAGQGVCPHTGRAGCPAQGVDDKGLRRGARLRHDARDLHPRAGIVGDPTDQQITTLSASSFMAAFVLHALLAEV